MMRVYVLLNVKSGTAEKVVRSLQNKSGVLLADIVERPPDIIMVVQAVSQERLLSLTVNALQSVETQIEGLQLLPERQKTLVLDTPLALRRN
jgi:hypothetical protein